MDCKFAIYCDTARAEDIKIHKEGCGHIKSQEGHDHEWFYAPTYQNAKIITGLLEKERNLLILLLIVNIVNHQNKRNQMDPKGFEPLTSAV